MPPRLALLICILFILYLFWTDRKRSKDVSIALWIPLIWMLLAGSRYLTHWLTLSPPVDSSDVYLEGNAVNRNVFLLLIVAGVIVLIRSKLAWRHLLARNIWVWLLSDGFR